MLLWYVRKVNRLGSVEYHAVMHENTDPGAFQVLAPFFEKFQVLGNLSELTTRLASLRRGPYYSTIVLQPNVESISLTLEPPVGPESPTIITPWRSWENVMNSISALPSIDRKSVV